MMLPLLASVSIAVAIGLAISSGVALRRVSSLPHVLLLASLAVAIGLGVASCTYFLWLLAFGPPAVALAFVELGLLAAIVAALLVARRRGGAPDTAADPDVRAPRLLVWSFGALLAGAGGAFLAFSQRSPHGGWDAWMTWNLHARFLFRGGENWQVMVSEASPLRHPDYPMLLPSLVARSWSYAGEESTAAPVLLALLFTLAVLGIVCSALAVLRTRSQGYLAGLVLLSTPFFVAHGASQYADIPVALYLVATLALLLLHERHGADTSGYLVLAGLAAGLAAWTKNEGWLFLATLVAARGLVVGRALGWRRLLGEARPFASGLAPVLLLVLYFKLWIAPANDLVSSSAQGWGATFARLAEPERYVYVATNVASGLLSFGANGPVGAVWLLLAYLLFVGVQREMLQGEAVRTGVVALALILCGQMLVYLVAPNDMPRLLEGSLERVLLQLWPATLLLFFMVARTLEEARDAAEPDAAARGTARTTHGAGRAG
jgi:hypothetical protein